MAFNIARIIIFTFAILWGLSASGYEIVQVPELVNTYLGEYVTEIMGLVLAWTIFAKVNTYRIVE